MSLYISQPVETFLEEDAIHGVVRLLNRMPGMFVSTHEASQFLPEQLRFSPPTETELNRLSEHLQTIKASLGSLAFGSNGGYLNSCLLFLQGFEKRLEAFEPLAQVRILRGQPLLETATKGNLLLVDWASSHPDLIFLYESLLGDPTWLFLALFRQWLRGFNGASPGQGNETLEIAGQWPGGDEKLLEAMRFRKFWLGGKGFEAQEERLALTPRDLGRFVDGRWVSVWAPHPDDELFVGALLANLPRSSVSLTVGAPDEAGVSDEYAALHLSARGADAWRATDRQGQTERWRLEKRQIRRQEAEASARNFQVTHLENLDLDAPLDPKGIVENDEGRMLSYWCRFSLTEADRRAIEAKLQREAQRAGGAENLLIVTISPFDRHPVHRLFSSALLNALALHAPEASVLFYEGLNRFEQSRLSPNLWCLYGESEQRLIEKSWRAHASQLWRNPDYIEKSRLIASRSAGEAGSAHYPYAHRLIAVKRIAEARQLMG